MPLSNYQCQLIEMLVQQVAMDQNIAYPDDISNVSEFTVQTLIPKFSTDEEESKKKAYLGKKRDQNDDNKIKLTKY